MTDISLQYFGPDRNQPPSHALPGGPPPEGLPISAAVYKASITYGRDSNAVVEALYEAVKSLETQILRGNQ
ncbi:hypothetical protein [Nocardia abscessus]|uniref:hypothetical protein n=1 Tax=Nocardia abscessus TaxID=120957 RepID=UPI002455B298|nr:hypothetical protein [Nocardia abscessus]